MKAPQKIKADWLRDDWELTLDDANGVWVAARPLNNTSLMERIKLAWGVLTGKYDALEWHEQ